MQLPLAAPAQQRCLAAFTLALLLARGVEAVEAKARAKVAAKQARAYLRGALAGDVNRRGMSSLAQVEQKTMMAQQQALEAVMAQEEQLEAKERLLEARQRRLSEQLNQFRHLEEAGNFIERARREIILIDWTSQLMGAGAYLVLIALATIIYGYLFAYEYGELEKYPDENVLKQNAGFAWSLLGGFSCDPDWRICFFSCFCMPIRWADTASNQKVYFGDFFPLLAIFSLCTALSSVTYGATSVILLVILVQHRQFLRQTYGLPNSTVGTRLEDCFIWLFCPICATMQEAMEVEFIEPPRLKGVRKVKETK